MSPKARQQLHQILLTAAVSGALIAAPRVAEAAVHTLSGSHTTTQTVITDTDPSVTVIGDASFEVTGVTTGDALTISGAGNIAYSSSIGPLITTITGDNGLDITSTGFNDPQQGAVTVNNAGTITGGNNGIFAINDGKGSININAAITPTTGSVTGLNGDGIHAFNTNSAGDGDVTISAEGAVSGGGSGIFAQNNGAGITSVITDGKVQGGDVGINIVTTSPGSPTTLQINSESLVQNSSGNTDDLAIQTVGVNDSTTTITNDGSSSGSIDRGIRGSVVLGDENDILNNNGTWNNTGGTTSTFGAGTDVFNNNTNGSFLAANTSGVSTAATTVTGIEEVNNTGDIVMQNLDPRIGNSAAVVGDVTQFTNGGNGIYNANGGTLFVDTNIATQQSDELHVDNVGIGSSGDFVDVRVFDGLGQRTTNDGIRIVQVDGTSPSNAFTLSNPVVGGLYDYLLRQGQVDPQSYFLQSNARAETVATGVLPILASRTALSTLSNVHDRQRDVEVLSDNANSRKGVWGRVFGQSNDFDSDDSNGFGFDSRLYGVQAGLDLLASGDGNGSRKYAGLYVAYASSSGDARQRGSKVADLDLDATTFGAYYTKYSASNWYLDLVAQYSRLSGIRAKTADNDINPSGNSYALSLEAGKQFNPNSSIIREVQAQLIDQYTDVDDVKLNDGTNLNLSSLNAVTGRFGVRLYGNPKSGKSFLPWLRANIWHTFSGDSTISSLGSSINTPIGGTSGELELGFTKGSASSGGWGIYGSAGYLFDISGAEYSGWKGTLGLRKGW